MIRLAVATRAETYERLDAAMEGYGIRVDHLPTTGRAIPLTGRPRSWGPEPFDVGYVYPPRTMEAAVVDELLDIPWLNDRDAVVTSRNKAAVLARLDRHRLPVPETVMISNPVDRDTLVECFERFDPPVVVKPNSTTRGAGVVRVDDVDSLFGVADYLGLLHEYPPTADKSYLVQEFLPDVRDYRAMVLDGRYVGAVERRLDRDGWTHNVHRGASAVGVSLDEDLRALSERVAAVLDVPFLGVDLLVNDDRTVISETNARPTVDEATKYEPDFQDRLAEAITSRVP